MSKRSSPSRAADLRDGGRAARRAGSGTSTAASRRGRTAPRACASHSPPTAARASSANGDGVLRRAALGRLRVGEHEPPPRARHRHVQQPPHLGDVRRLGVGRQRLLEQRVGDRLERAPARAGHARAHQAEHVDVVELEALGRVHRHHLHADRAVAGHRLLLAQPGLGDRGDRAGELARGRLRRAADVGGGELGELGEVDEPLDDLDRGGEQQLAAQPEPLDQAVDVEVGAGGVERRRGRAVELEERADALARLGRDLRRLERGAERGDHVELAAAGDLGAAGDVDRAQLDRRAGERAHDGAGVAGVDEQPQPRQQVAHLGALEERRGAREPVRHRALLERDRHRLALVADRAHEHADVLGRDVLARDQPLDLGGDGLRLRALVVAAPERDLAAGRAARAPSRSGPAPARRPRAAAARIRSGQRWLSSSRTTVAAGHSASKSRRFLAAAPRRRWIAWSSSPAALIWPCSPASSRSSRPWAKFASCSSSTSTWRKRSVTRARTRGCVRSRRNASSTRSPKSRVPDSCSQRSWAA